MSVFLNFIKRAILVATGTILISTGIEYPVLVPGTGTGTGTGRYSPANQGRAGFSILIFGWP